MSIKINLVPQGLTVHPTGSETRTIEPLTIHKLSFDASPLTGSHTLNLLGLLLDTIMNRMAVHLYCTQFETGRKIIAIKYGKNVHLIITTR